jgi:hypothetical protein
VDLRCRLFVFKQAVSANGLKMMRSLSGAAKFWVEVKPLSKLIHLGSLFMQGRVTSSGKQKVGCAPCLNTHKSAEFPNDICFAPFLPVSRSESPKLASQVLFEDTLLSRLLLDAH